MSKEEDQTPATAAEDIVEDDEEEEDDDEEDLEKLQAEIARMEAEAARISKENDEMEKGGGGENSNNPEDDAAAKQEAAAVAAAKDKCSIYVGQVDYAATPEALLGHFEACGTVERVTIVCDKFTGKPSKSIIHGFLFLSFER